jgi:DNA-binding transcriptional LysR family regulator
MTYNLQLLQAFATIVSCGSLRRAAEALHVTQPALSRTMQRLEKQVGDKPDPTLADTLTER